MNVNSVSHSVVLELSPSLPVAEVKPIPEAVQADTLPSDQFQTHTVIKGDTLWAISGAKLKGPHHWPEIFKLNQDQIRNPDLIYPGQVLRLPEEPIIPATPVLEPVVPSTSSVHQPVFVSVPAPNNFVTKDPIIVKKGGNGMMLVALAGGTLGAVGTGATLIGITRSLVPPLASLGGYATAQKVAGFLASKGLSVPTGPTLSKMITSVGGPKVAGAGAAIGVGLAVAGLAVGGYYLYNKLAKD